MAVLQEDLKRHPVKTSLGLDEQARKYLVIFCAGMVTTTFLALLVSYYHIGFPLLGWIFHRDVLFSDWYDLYRLAPRLPDPRLPQLFSPPIDMLGRFARDSMSEPVSAIFLYYLPILACLLALWRLAKNILVVLLVLLSYPCFFAIARGNMELQVCLLVFVALMSLFKGKSIWFLVLIFLASLVKPFALAFLLIIVRDQPRRAISVIGGSAVTNLFLLYLLGHSNFDALPRYLHMAHNYEQLMALYGVGDLYNNSFYTLGKLLFRSSNRFVLYGSALLSLLIVGGSYLHACRTLGVFDRADGKINSAALGYATIFFLPLIICLCVPVSADYRLNYFLISVYFLVAMGDQLFSAAAKTRLLWIYFLIIIPKHFVLFYFPGGILRYGRLPPTIEMTSQSIINPILMLVLCATLGLGLRSNIGVARRYLVPSAS